MQKEKDKIIIYSIVASGTKRSKRTLICEVCKKPYTDNISADAKTVICALCSMGLADAIAIRNKYGQIDYEELVEAIKVKKLRKFRNKYGFTQGQLANRIGVTARHLRNIENSPYIPSSKVIRKIEKKLKNFRCA